MKKYIYLLFLLFALSICNANTIKTPYNKAVTAEQWQVVDFVIKAKIKVDNPFIVDFSAVFTGPENTTMQIPGFYDGDNNWIIRFSGSQIGEWTFKTTSEIKALNSKSGKLKVTENTNPDNHGGIVKHEDNPQHFYYEDGTPYMALAFECDWLFALDHDNPNDAPKTKHLLNLLNKNGLNQVVTTVFSYDIGKGWEQDDRLDKYPEFNYRGIKERYPFLGSNEEPDFSGLNVKFFQQMDRTMGLLQDYNIAAHLMVYVWNKRVTWPKADTEADNMYFDYILKRYQVFSNIIWDVSKEAINSWRCTEEYALERIERIRNLDAYDRLLTVHDYGFCNRNPEQIDFVSWQNWNATLYNDMLNIRTKYKTLPVFNVEHGGYEESPFDVFPGDYTNPELCVRRNYLCHFAGGYSTYYWQAAAWFVIIHNPYEQTESFIKPKFEYYKHLNSFFTKYPFSEFKPKPEYNNSGYCMTNDKGCYLLYVPKENYKLSIFWKQPPARKEGTMQWYNILTGEYTDVMKSTKSEFTSPWRGEADAILIRQVP